MKVARAPEVTAQRGGNRERRRARLWVNWSLALLIADIVFLSVTVWE